MARERRPVGGDDFSVESVRVCSGAHVCGVCSLEGVVSAEAHGCGCAEVDERVAEACTGVFPVALVRNVVSIKPKRNMALLAVRCVACAQVEEVVAGYADGIVSCGFFACGVAPAWHYMEVSHVRNEQIRKDCGANARRV